MPPLAVRAAWPCHSKDRSCCCSGLARSDSCPTTRSVLFFFFPSLSLLTVVVGIEETSFAAMFEAMLDPTLTGPTAKRERMRLLGVIVSSLSADASTPSPSPAVRHPDATERARMGETSVGRTVDFCAPVAMPVGWLPLYWFSDSSRCHTSAASAAFNVLRAERQY